MTVEGDVVPRTVSIVVIGSVQDCSCIFERLPESRNPPATVTGRGSRARCILPCLASTSPSQVAESVPAGVPSFDREPWLPLDPVCREAP